MDRTPLTVPALLAAAVREFGDRAYVVTPGGTPDSRLTYAEAGRRSAEKARRLLAHGVGKGTRVGLFLPNDAQWVTWWLAVSRIGAIAVPLSTLYRPAEIAKVLRLADVAVLIAPSRALDTDVVGLFEEALPGLVEHDTGQLQIVSAPYLRTIVLTGPDSARWAAAFDDGQKVSPAILDAAQEQVSPADLAIMVHTSGSTADPKGVLHTHGTLVRQTSTWPAAIRAVTGSRADPVILSAMPFFWIGGVLAAMGALHEPITLLVMSRPDAGTALDLIEAERATGVVGWPAFTRRLREHPTFGRRDLSSVPMLRDGPLDIAMTDVPDGFPVHRTMTETAGGFVCTDIAIIDAEGVPVGDGEVGELLVRGVGVMAGYNKRERSDTFDADGWYHTGDRVYRRSGDPRLFYVGRTSELIKTSGANVSPLEVEAVIEGFDEVVQCVVVGVAHAERGEEVCAVLVPHGDTVDVETLAKRTRELLSPYKVPTRWITVDSAQIPNLPSGKLNRKALQDWVISSPSAGVR